MQSNNQEFVPLQTVRWPGQDPRQAQKALQTIVVAVFIILDATGSMAELIAGVVKALVRFTEILYESNLKPSLGLVVFRDELQGEKTHVFPLGTSPEEIRQILRKTRAEGGDDAPESSLPAIMRAIEGFEGVELGTKKIALHITDAPTHDPESGYTRASVRSALTQNQVIYFACAPAIEPYKTFANVAGGTLFPLTADIEAEAFKDVLLSVAHQTVKTVRRDGPILTADALDILREMTE